MPIIMELQGVPSGGMNPDKIPEKLLLKGDTKLGITPLIIVIYLQFKNRF